jgi:hypothetical protein
MAEPEAFDKQQESERQHVVQEVFSSEKREDIWAIIIVIGIFLLSVAFPDQVYHFFNKVLYLF